MYRTNYAQNYRFDTIGNMTLKASTETTMPKKTAGASLNYNLAYKYYAGYAHRAEQIGDMYYSYDENGNLTEERFGGHSTQAMQNNHALKQEGNRYSTDYGFALVPETAPSNVSGIFQRNYTWNERNQLTHSQDNRFKIDYRYGFDGERTIKYVQETQKETMYANRFWQTSYLYSGSDWHESKNIFVGEARIATKRTLEGNQNLGYEQENQYWYHTDHLGSAQGAS
jgi:hypothetical protein